MKTKHHTQQFNTQKFTKHVKWKINSLNPKNHNLVDDNDEFSGGGGVG